MLEVLSNKKIRYTKQPRFLSHKIDNISIALRFIEENLGIKVVGCQPAAIANGNSTQILGLIFLLVQKIKTNEKGTYFNCHV